MAIKLSIKFRDTYLLAPQAKRRLSDLGEMLGHEKIKLDNDYEEEKKELISINITPLIDIVFLLLVFFMLATSFIQKSTMEVNLSTGKYTNFINFTKKVARMLGANPKVVGTSKTPEGVFARAGDTKKLKKFGIKHSITLEMGIKKSLDYFLNNK